MGYLAHLFIGSKFFIVVGIVWLLIGLLVFFENSRPKSVQRVMQLKRNRREFYVEYRRWKLWWGLTLDSQKETNRLIDDWNDAGYTCTYFENSGLVSNITIFRLILISFVWFATLGFVGYYVGPSLLFALADNDVIKDYGDFVAKKTPTGPQQQTIQS